MKSCYFRVKRPFVSNTKDEIMQFKNSGKKVKKRFKLRENEFKEKSKVKKKINDEKKRINDQLTLYNATTICEETVDNHISINDSILNNALNIKRIRKRGKKKDFPLTYFCLLCSVSPSFSNF